MEKDSKSEASPEKTQDPLETLRDTISKSISALIIDTQPIWDRIHKAQIDSKEREEAWDEIYRLNDYNDNVNKFNQRIVMDFYTPVYDRVEGIKESAKRVIELLATAAGNFRGLCHHPECEYPEGCPNDHTGDEVDDDDGYEEQDCHSLLNLLTPFYWKTAQQLESIYRDVSVGILQNEEAPLAMVFALSKSVHRFDTITSLSAMQTLLNSHDDSYDVRGLKEFYALREGIMYKISKEFEFLGTELTGITQELKYYAQAWKVKKQSK